MQELLQFLNSAVVKNKENEISSSFEKRLRNTCATPAMKFICKAIEDYSESANIPKDQAAVEIIQTFSELNKVWSDYIASEGINVLKQMLSKQSETHSEQNSQRKRYTGTNSEFNSDNGNERPNEKLEIYGDFRKSQNF